MAHYADAVTDVTSRTWSVRARALKKPSVKADAHRMGRIRRTFVHRRRKAPELGPSVAAGRPEADVSTSERELQAALVETAHERDVSIARASEAEARERLAHERLGSLASLEHRVEVAERRALDAERRLEEISERVNGPSEPPDAPDTSTDAEGSPTPSLAGPTSELRARLTRAAARKRLHRGPE